MKEYIELINKLFESRMLAHMYHLQSEQYSSHKALDEYYEKITPIIDDMVEVYQGQYNKILEGYDIIKGEHQEDVIKYFEDLGTFLVSERNNYIAEQDVHLQAILDEGVNLVFKTLYQLRFLK